MTAPIRSSDLTWSPVALDGGLHGARAIPDPSDAQQLQNWTLFRGRFSLRGPLAETVRLRDVPDTADVTSVLAVEYHVAKCYVVAHSTVTSKCYLYRLKLTGAAEDDGETETPIVDLSWDGASPPRVNLTSFEGGSATDPKQRLYISDSTNTHPPKYWDSTDSTLNAVEEDFDDEGSKESLNFPLIFAYNDHLFGTDFVQSSAFQLGLLRYSQPGLIPADEPGVTNNPSREWWFSDRRQVGSRGDKIIGVGPAGPAMILAKRRRMYSFEGFDAASWVLRPIAGADALGAVGPHALSGLPDGNCLVWTDKGPHLTDGKRIVDISETIRRRVIAVTFTADTTVEYSPDDGVCYCVVADDSGAPYIYYGWDVARGRFIGEGSWKANGGGDLRLRDMRAVADDALPGPAAAASGLSVAIVSDTELTATWTNGDTALDVVTDVYRHTSTFTPPGTGTLLDTVASGVTSYADTGRTSQTEYFYRVIHRRNGQSSAASNEDSATTAVRTPNPCLAQTISGGIRVTITQNEPIGTPDLVIERQTGGGGYSTLTTLNNQTTGVKTHDDTTASTGVEYDYRVKATDAGQTDSPYSNVATATADQTALTIDTVTHSAALVDEGACAAADPIVTVTWAGTNFGASDTAKIYQNDDRGGYVLRATVAIGTSPYVDLWPYANGAMSRFLQYKVEGWENGTVNIDNAESTESTESVTECTQA